MHNHQCPQYLCNCVPQIVSDINNYNLIIRTIFHTGNCKAIWNDLNRNVRNIPTLYKFKSRIKGITVKPPEYYRGGSRRYFYMWQSHYFSECPLYDQEQIRLLSDLRNTKQNIETSSNRKQKNSVFIALFLAFH